MSKAESPLPVNFELIEDEALRCEDLNERKSAKKIAEYVGEKSFAEEVEHDKNAVAVLLARGEAAQKAIKDGKMPQNFTKQELEHEAASADIFKRALILVGSGDLQVTDGDKTKSAADNGLPVASYLCHGSRIAVEIPAGSEDKLINWLTTGDVYKSGLSEKQDQKLALEEDKVAVYSRPAATHGVKIDKNGVKETKGFFLGARDYLSNKLFGKKTNHYGVNLGLSAPLNGRSADGEVVHSINGEHGHLYMHYVPPTKDKPGALLIGSEDAAPTSEKHSKFGVGGKVSAAGGSKFPDLKQKHKLADEKAYEDTVIPQKYNGLSIKMDQKSLAALTSIKSDEFGPELAARMPSRTVKDFKDFKENKGRFHEKPNFVRPKQSVLTEPEISKAKLIANKITFGLAYKKEVEKYKENTKTYELQVKLKKRWGQTQKAELVESINPGSPVYPDTTPVAKNMAQKRASGVNISNG